MIADISIYTLILIIINILLLIWIIRIEMKMRYLLAGKNAKSLEDTILYIKNGLENLNELSVKTKKQIEDTERKRRKNIKKIETVRFNPFKGTGDGGNQSFATALLDEDGDGVVLSSLYSRERVSVFAKPIKNYSSLYEMSKEEKDVISKSKLS